MPRLIHEERSQLLLIRRADLSVNLCPREWGVGVEARRRFLGSVVARQRVYGPRMGAAYRLCIVAHHR